MTARIKKKRDGPYSVLIVSEGQNTERNYFIEFEKYLNSKFKIEYPDGIKFTILPFEEEQPIADEENQFLKRKVGKRKVLNFESVISEDVETIYSAAPIRWVRYAQKKAENSGFNEIWSVFDFDNRGTSFIKAAYELAQLPIIDCDEKVKIAYSSYSFEFWLLLHYELCLNYFGFSECKNAKSEELNCGHIGNSILGDCSGTRCLGGYMRVRQYEVGFYNKTTKSTFPALKDFINKARYHSNFVRNQIHNASKEIWEMKPVTTMDLLIDSLTRNAVSINWQFVSNIITAGKFTLSWSASAKGILNIRIIPTSNKTILILKGDIKLLNIDFDEYDVNNRIFTDSNSNYDLQKINLAKLPILPVYISLNYDNKVFVNKL